MSSPSLKKKEDNPFAFPDNKDVFMLRAEEKQRKLEQRNKIKHQSLIEKSKADNPASRVLKEIQSSDIPDQSAKAKPDLLPVLTEASAAKEKRKDKGKLNDFVQQKRDMFLVQYSLSVKREEMRKLEEEAQEREAALRKKEKMLEEDATRFDAFLKENDMKAAEAIKRAEAETRAKLDTVQEIKRLNGQIMSLQSEMGKYYDQLADCRRYKQFLDTLTPPEWFHKHGLNPPTSSPRKLVESESVDEAPSTGEVFGDTPAALGINKLNISSNVQEEDTLSAAGGDDFDNLEVIDVNNTIPMYFTEPQQLLDIFSELEERNLFLIQNAQETEVGLDELRAKYKATEEKMNAETGALSSQIEQLRRQIEKEEEKGRALRERAKYFQLGAAGNRDQQDVLEELHSQVEEVYRGCGLGDADARVSTLDMLTAIERRLEDLFGLVENMPPAYVEKAEKAREKERRQQQRTEKVEMQKQAQEARVKRAIERANAPVKKKV